ncbi:hypothetical protein HYU10_00960 [Candidatus Woesearchaeota archaeon]|nr:hypothetical protein [Candidatus Woesearchaeota archaeon]MBI2130317.1 hypothetical protein [Candidatus Woesearchaeota archaeon]MBI2661774.1 hypothetical protein [Candidatus Woesearchaeota archaeon]
MTMIKKTQISADFIITISISLIVFLAVFYIADNRNTALRSYEAGLYARQEADRLALELNSIFIAGPNSTSTIFFAGILKDGTPYNLTLVPLKRTANIEYDFEGLQRQHQAGILTANITGDLMNIRGNIMLSSSGRGILVERQP